VFQRDRFDPAVARYGHQVPKAYFQRLIVDDADAGVRHVGDDDFEGDRGVAGLPRGHLRDEFLFQPSAAPTFVGLGVGGGRALDGVPLFSVSGGSVGGSVGGGSGGSGGNGELIVPHRHHGRDRPFI